MFAHGFGAPRWVWSAALGGEVASGGLRCVAMRQARVRLRKGERVQEASGEALDGAGAQSNIGDALELTFEARGLTAPSVTAVTASAILPSPPPPPPSPAHALEKGTLCIVAIVSAFLLF